MPRMVSFVFKVLIMTVLIAMFVSFTACIIDIFVTTTRIQSLAQMMQYDIAQNNCLLNDTYEGFKSELYDISTRSRYMKVCCQGEPITVTHYEPDAQGNANLNALPAIQLFASGTDASQNYIQLNNDDVGTLLDSTTDIPSANEFAVANYGDILQLNINTVVNARMWALGSDGSGLSDVSEYAINGRGGRPLTLRFTIPALTYIK